MEFLSKEDITELEQKHRHERDGRVRDRIKAVLLFNEGWSKSLISQALRISEQTVYNHLEDFKSEKKLKPLNGGSTSELNQKQTDQLIHHLTNKIYTQVSDICGFVAKEFHVTFTVSGLTKWLHRNGFSYKKPKNVPAKVDLIKQEEFKEKYLNLIDSLPDNEMVLFIDSVHPTMATKTTHGWIRTGQDKEIATTASRTRVNLTGAINLNTLKVSTQAYETINGKTTIEFLKHLESTYSNASKIHIILDQSGYHKCQEVEDFIKNSKFQFHFLPPYSPNLNPIERLWKVMNEKVRNNRVFHSAKEFKKAIFDFFDIEWSKIAYSMRGRINDNFQILKIKS